MFVRKARQILSHKIVLCLYPLVLTLLFLGYFHCKLNRDMVVSQKDTRTIDVAKKIHCYLFVFIMTSPGGIVKRKAIRETWLGNHKFHMHVSWRFIIGTKGLSSTTMKDLQKEQENYSDILFLTNHKDSYQNLTSKLLKSLMWIRSYVESKFVMKADDDTFSRLDILLNDMKNHENMNRIYWGYFRGNARVKKIGQWSEKSWFLSDHYLPYALGGGYILTFDLIDYISRVSEMLHVYQSEDVSLGVWLAPVKLNRIHDIRFDTEFKSRGCSNNHVVSHKQSNENMYEKHYQILNYNRLCTVEKEVMHVFEYNWEVPPSQCCKRVPRKELEFG